MGADRDPGKKDSKNMAWKSVYFEFGNDNDKVLRDYAKVKLQLEKAMKNGSSWPLSRPAMDALPPSMWKRATA